jgi:hypothetical protein
MIAQAKVVFLPLPLTLILRMLRFGGGNQNISLRKAHPTRVQMTSLVTLRPQTVLISPSRRVTNWSLSRHFPAIYVSTLHLVASSW